MKAFFAPIVFSVIFLALLPHIKSPIEEAPQIGNCYSSPTAMVIEKTKDGYKQEGVYSKIQFEVAFKIVDIRIKNGKKYYIVKFFKDSYDTRELYPEYAFYTEERFNQMLPTLGKWADMEYKVCRKSWKDE